jgi:hypothetical protein
VTTDATYWFCNKEPAIKKKVIAVRKKVETIDLEIGNGMMIVNVVIKIGN